MVDALTPLGVTDVPMPASPVNVWTAIQAARAGGTGRGRHVGRGGRGVRERHPMASRRGLAPRRNRTGQPGRWVVIPAAFEYERVDSVDAALAALAEHGDDA